MVQDILDELNGNMENGLAAMKRSMQKVRTGRASIGILDGVMVDYYGSLTPLNQLATLSAPEPRLLTIQPWDKGALECIEKAIMKSDLGLTPNNDGTIIRIPIPPLNEERRKDLVKLVKKMGEEFKVEMRNHRRNANNFLKDLEKDKEINQDEHKRAEDEVQKITDTNINKIDEMMALKEKEIMEV